MTHDVSLLRRMLTVERAKVMAVKAGVVEAIAEILSPDTKMPAALSYEAISEMLSVLALITIPTGFSAEQLDDLSRAAALNGRSQVREMTRISGVLAKRCVLGSSVKLANRRTLNVCFYLLRRGVDRESLSRLRESLGVGRVFFAGRR